MKTGLVMEGGAMRGLFTAGVLDVLMEHQVEVDGAIGVSAGAAFGCNYKSKQIGRVIRYNKRFCNDPRFVSMRSLLFTGDIYGEDFCYHEIPEHLDVFDWETYRDNPMEFYVVCTDVKTGKPVYHKCGGSNEEDLQWMRASASMPMVSKMVSIDGYKLSDGGTGDSIPLQFFESIGYERNIVILTQPDGFVKHPHKLLPMMRIVLHRYPKLLRALEIRHKFYNKTLLYIKKQEKAGNIVVVRPERPLNIGPVEHDPDELERVYQLGRREAEKRLPQIQAFLKTAC